METIQQLVESANPWRSLQSDAAKLANKWEKTGLLEGLGEDINKNNMALMLENQAKQNRFNNVLPRCDNMSEPCC